MVCYKSFMSRYFRKAFLQNKYLSYSRVLNKLKENNTADNAVPEQLFEDEDYKNFVSRYLGESERYDCYIIHPYVKWGQRKLRDTTPTLQVEEAIALIRTLYSWKIIDTVITPLESLTKKKVFGSGTLAKLQKRIRGDSNITAVFLNMGILTNIQIEELEKIFGVPIFDRYKIVMQILKLHAVSKHAKLQIALAEIPYLQARLKQDSQLIVSDNYDIRKLMLQNREQKLIKAINKLRSQRQLLRNSRNKVNYPIIAVVGYTNSGKTSLIKALTNEQKLQPQDKFFATLDVTLHSGVLPSNLEVLYVDTVGFISNIPTGLIECFIATLEDAMHADIILHVEDLSNPNVLHQRNHVLSTLENLAQKANASDVLGKIITVGNKCDIAAEDAGYTNIKISSKTNLGIKTLQEKLEDEVIKRTGRLKLIITVPVGSDEVRWLYKNATVVNATPDSIDSQYQKMKIIIAEEKLHQFKSTFI